jgi:hypothetical protein
MDPLKMIDDVFWLMDPLNMIDDMFWLMDPLNMIDDMFWLMDPLNMIDDMFWLKFVFDTGAQVNFKKRIYRTVLFVIVWKLDLQLPL